MNNRNQFLFFCISGTIGFMVDVALLYTFTALVGWYSARILSFMSAATITWLFNRLITFRTVTEIRRNQGNSVSREFVTYLFSVSGGAALNYAVYATIVHKWNSPLAPLAGVACGSIAGMGLNFISARYMVFRKKS